MINHVRTLLMNRLSGRFHLKDPGEEYIELAYAPRVLPTALQTFFTAIFGTIPDRIGVNYRMRQIMQLLHASELQQDVTSTDSRITYLPFDDTFFDDVFKQQFAFNGTPQRCVIVGTHTPSAALGRLQYAWDLVVNNDASVTVTAVNDPIPAAVVTDRTHGIPLPGTALQAYLYDAPNGTRVRVTSTGKPVDDIMTVILRAIRVSGPAVTELIFPPIAAEPVLTWNKIWRDHPDTVNQCAALLLAIAHYIDQL